MAHLSRDDVAKEEVSIIVDETPMRPRTLSTLGTIVMAASCVMVGERDYYRDGLYSTRSRREKGEPFSASPEVRAARKRQRDARKKNRRK